MSLSFKDIFDRTEAVLNPDDSCKDYGYFSKTILKCEIKSKLNARRSIVTNKMIKKGEMFTESNIIMKRPGTGIPPQKIYKVLGRKAKRNLKEDQILKVSDIK